MNTLEKAIVQIVNDFGGCKTNELIPKLDKTIIIQYSTSEIIDAINQLVKQGELIEVEYVLHQMDYRIKSFLLPKKTELMVRGKVV